MKRIIAALLLCILGICMIGNTAEGKLKKIYLGKYYCTSYHASDNTPAETHCTSSGAYATENWTCAVDMNNPLVPMGSLIYIEGFGLRKVQDCGNFRGLNNGLRQIDMFMHEGEGGLYFRKIWLVKPETKAERKKRLAKIKKRKQKIARKIKQKREFILKFDPSVPYGEIRTHKGILPDATVLVEWYHEPFTKFQYLETDASLEGDDNVIYIGDKAKVLKYKKIKFVEVVEGAVG